MKDGAVLLDDVHTFLGRFVAYPSPHARIAHALWIIHTHVMDAWESTPRICFLSPEPESGKTRALEVSELLVPSAVEAVNVSPAYLFRKVGSEDSCTLLYDEIDTVFGPKAKENEEIRGLLNAGHRRGAVAGRCVVRGKTVETEEISAYCAVALAGIGWLPDTILSRSVIIRMRRRAPGERVESFRRRLLVDVGHALRDRIAIWAVNNLDALRDARPAMPPGIEDRKADVWELLLAIADLAGGEWPRLARVAAVALVADAQEHEPSLGVRLLSDLRTVFGNANQMATTSILAALHDLPESPWNDLKGKPLNERGLAHRLRQFSIKSKTVRIGEMTPKGYARDDLADAWARYLPPPPQAAGSATSATSATNAEKPSKSGADVADSEADVAPHDTPETPHDTPENPEETGHVADVADVADLAGGGRGGAVCAQCAASNEPLWNFQPPNGDPAVWLHQECRPFWLKANPQPTGKALALVRISEIAVPAAKRPWHTPRLDEIVRPAIPAQLGDSLDDFGR